MQTSARTAPAAEEAVASPATGPRWLRDRRIILYGALLLAVAIRAAHVLAADFPLNDGGLFYRMTQEIEAADFRLPAFTDYNDANIPFAYSPAAFYITAAIHAVTGISLVSLFRFLPLLATSLLVVAFYRLARDLLDDRDAVIAAVVAFAVVPRSFSWLLMGGGLTRSFGLLFALVALHQAYRLYTTRAWRYAATTAGACALTVLSHISTAAFLAFSIAILFAFYGRHWRGVAASAVVVAATVALTAPWWATVVAEHGVAPFLAARASSGTVFSDIDSRYTALVRLAQFNLLTTGEPLFPLVGFLAVLGALTTLRRAASCSRSGGARSSSSTPAPARRTRRSPPRSSPAMASWTWSSPRSDDSTGARRSRSAAWRGRRARPGSCASRRRRSSPSSSSSAPPPRSRAAPTTGRPAMDRASPRSPPPTAPRCGGWSRELRPTPASRWSRARRGTSTRSPSGSPCSRGVRA
jgi:hypothetical protein